MAITLTPMQEKLVTKLIENGQFSAPEDVVQAALNLVEKQFLSETPLQPAMVFGCMKDQLLIHGDLDLLDLAMDWEMNSHDLLNGEQD